MRESSLCDIQNSKDQFSGLCSEISVDTASSVQKFSFIVYGSLKKHILFDIPFLHSINRLFHLKATQS